VIANVAGSIVRLSGWVVVTPRLSVTRAEIVYDPCVVGRPLIVAPEAVNPGGSDVIAHVYGGVPPVADNVCSPYDTPTAPLGSGELVVIANVGGPTISVRVLLLLPVGG
jgi:hypothetical protein